MHMRIFVSIILLTFWCHPVLGCGKMSDVRRGFEIYAIQSVISMLLTSEIWWNWSWLHWEFDKQDEQGSSGFQKPKLHKHICFSFLLFVKQQQNFEFKVLIFFKLSNLEKLKNGFGKLLLFHLNIQFTSKCHFSI